MTWFLTNVSWMWSRTIVTNADPSGVFLDYWLVIVLFFFLSFWCCFFLCFDIKIGNFFFHFVFFFFLFCNWSKCGAGADKDPSDQTLNEDQPSHAWVFHFDLNFFDFRGRFNEICVLVSLQNQRRRWTRHHRRRWIFIITFFFFF